MKKIVLLYFGLLIFGISGCFKPVDNIRSFRNIPAIVIFDHSMQPTLVTSDAILIAPELSELILAGNISEGDAVLSSFSVNYDKQPNSDYISVTDLRVGKPGKTTPIESEEGASISGDFDSQIFQMDLFGTVVYNSENIVFFFYFYHLAAIDQDFDYEITYDPNEPEYLYFRAKISGESSLDREAIANVHAVDLSRYIMTLIDNEKIMFFIEFNIGGGEEGEERFASWFNNPVFL